MTSAAACRGCQLFKQFPRFGLLNWILTDHITSFVVLLVGVF